MYGDAEHRGVGVRYGLTDVRTGLIMSQSDTAEVSIPLVQEHVKVNKRTVEKAPGQGSGAG